MGAYENLELELSSSRQAWLVTGVAGFVGSNLLQALLEPDRKVVGLDNFSTGKKQNLTSVQRNRHSLADISKARRLLGYAPAYRLSQGLERTLAWYSENLS